MSFEKRLMKEVINLSKQPDKIGCFLLCTKKSPVEDKFQVDKYKDFIYDIYEGVEKT